MPKHLFSKDKPIEIVLIQKLQMEKIQDKNGVMLIQMQEDLQIGVIVKQYLIMIKLDKELEIYY